MYSNDIYNALNVAAIQAVVDTYGTGYAIFNSMVIPSDCTGKKTVNFYQLGAIDCRMEYGLARYTANCRAETQSESLVIAKAIIAEINMKTYLSYVLFCQLETPIRPEDETDTWNYPIEITIKKR